MSMTASTEWDRSDLVDQRVEALLDRMTLEEKIDLVTGDLNFDYGFYNAPQPQHGIPALTMADGPAGIRINKQDVHGGTATALPAPIALAATWDTGLASSYGDVLGREAYATGHNVMLGPAVDIARVPVAGRTFESFGEDPLLQARMAVPIIQAIQSHPVEATIKHYLVNNQEYQRSSIDVDVDDRTLQEIYLPPFAAAVQQAHVAAAMGSFNKINGVFACEHPVVLGEILRDRLGFLGWVMSDYGANHSTVESAAAGLDQEQPGAGHWGQQLLDAVIKEEVGLDVIDEKVRRILRPMIGLGLLDRPVEITPLPIHDHGDVARGIAEQGIVLLKNTGGLLPLSAKTLGSIAVIGPDADTCVAGGGSGLVKPTYTITPLEGIRRRAGQHVRVTYAEGTDPISTAALLPGPPPVPSSILAPPGGRPDQPDQPDQPGECGLRGEYWDNPRFEGDPLLTRIDPQVDLNLGFFNFPGFNASSPKSPVTPGELNGQISVRWTGTITAPATGDYVLALTGLGTTSLALDGRPLIRLSGRVADPFAPATEDRPVPASYGQFPTSAPTAELMSVNETVHLVAGEPHTVQIDYAADSPEQGWLTGAQIRFGWRPPTGVVSPSIANAATLAGRSDVAIVVVRTYESEQADRPDMVLPGEQDELVRAVASANPRTIVVLMSGGPVETSWDETTPAILEAWYSGQEQGNAIARVLFGDVNPSGKLPLTFPRSMAETPIAADAARYPGKGEVVHYSEGILVGYRGYDELEIDPRYPFGHGLSYTTFQYDRLRIDGTEVSFDVTNSGAVAGVEVAQLYVGKLPTEVMTPPRQLADFARVRLEPGESRCVTVSVTRRALSFWDPQTSAWTTPAGPVPVYVGGSSRDIRLSGILEVSED